MSLNWYPIINYDTCSLCRICYEFCKHGVYDWDEEKGPVVVKREACVHGCHGCEKECPSGSISYYGDIPRRKLHGADIIEL